MYEIQDRVKYFEMPDGNIEGLIFARFPKISPCDLHKLTNLRTYFEKDTLAILVKNVFGDVSIYQDCNELFECVIFVKYFPCKASFFYS